MSTRIHYRDFILKPEVFSSLALAWRQPLGSVNLLAVISNGQVTGSRILFVIPQRGPALRGRWQDSSGALRPLTPTPSLNARALVIKQETRWWSPRGTAGTPQAAVCAAMSAQEPSSSGSGTWWAPPVCHSLHPCRHPGTHTRGGIHTGCRI